MKQAAASEARRRTVDIQAGGRPIAAELHVPRGPRALVVLAGRRQEPAGPDPVAESLHDASIATLELGLNDQPGGPHRASRALVISQAEQVLAAADWVSAQPELAQLPLGVFGARTAGGVALAAAAKRPGVFRAVVSTAGRPDLAPGLDDMHAATLFIVADDDEPSITINQEAMARVRGIAELEVLAGTPDSLTEGASLAYIAQITRRWFARFLS
jgi:putative phosphoribosyl transferase